MSKEDSPPDLRKDMGHINARIGNLLVRGHGGSLAVLASLSSLASLAISFMTVLGVIGIPNPKDTDLFFAFVATLVAVCLSTIGCMWLLYRSERYAGELLSDNRVLAVSSREKPLVDKDHAQIYGIINYLIHYIDRYQVGAGQAEYDIFSEDGNIDEAKVSRLEQFHRVWAARISLSILNNAVQIFERLTGERCAACIKVLTKVMPDGSPIAKYVGQNGPTSFLTGMSNTRIVSYFVKTAARDTISREDREAHEAAKDGAGYSVTENTAFLNILDGRFPGSHFASNDLTADPAYRNSNPYWKNFYKSTLVVPIYIPMAVDVLQVKDYERQVIGFLCIDSKHAKLDEVVCLNVAKVLARLAAFTMHWQLENSDPDENEDEDEGDSSVNEEVEANTVSRASATSTATEGDPNPPGSDEGNFQEVGAEKEKK